MLVLMTVLTGIVYPLIVTDLGCCLFPSQASGSLIRHGERVLGSSLLAQKFEEPDLFWPRPSACDYATVPSGASNLGPTSAAFAKALSDRRKTYGDNATGDLLAASGSGLDPDISPEAALSQIDRVAASRHLEKGHVQALVMAHVQPPQFGVFGQSRVNVLALNLDLAELR